MAKRSDPFAVEITLDRLLGLPLSTFGLAADMPMLGFGPTSLNQRGGLVPAWSLHPQCPWRLRSTSTILTGNGDVYEFAGAEAPPAWSYEDGDTRIAKRVAAIIATEPLVVSVLLEPVTGDLRIGLAGDLVLEIFPNSVEDEQWRLFAAGDAYDHVVFPPED